MKTLAVTGSSGSGKTTISKLFLRLEDTFLINTDELAKEMAENDDKYLNEIILSFGKYILNESGNLNRKKLSNIIFESESAQEELNRITKRNILPKIDKIISENSDKKLIVIDVPILYENSLENHFDKVLAVISKREEQLKRIITRDGIELTDAEKRLNIQLGNDFFEKKADFVINNCEKTIDDLYKEVIKIYFKMLS